MLLMQGTNNVDVRNMFIVQLAPDFLSFNSSAITGPLPGPHIVEAPAFFRRGGTYYALLGGCTCPNPNPVPHPTPNPSLCWEAARAWACMGEAWQC